MRYVYNFPIFSPNTEVLKMIKNILKFSQYILEDFENEKG